MTDEQTNLSDHCLAALSRYNHGMPQNLWRCPSCTLLLTTEKEVIDHAVCCDKLRSDVGLDLIHHHIPNPFGWARRAA